MARIKTPKIFRSAISDEAKLAEAKKRRDSATRTLVRWAAKLDQANKFVNYYEEKLGLRNPLPKAPKKAPSRKRGTWLEGLEKLTR